jgi:heat-inducible transcriptional repressor
MEHLSGQHTVLQRALQSPFDTLSDRERAILRAVVHHFILTANPVGSRTLSKHLVHELSLSAATIRNVMSDLEEMGFIVQPHTSAGRVPTDKGYRFYVDSMQNIETLNDYDRHAIEQNITSAPVETILRDVSKILGSMSHYLGVVRLPAMADVIVKKIDAVQLSSDRLLVVLSLGADNVRTITLEARFDIDFQHLHSIVTQMNERIAGRSIEFLRTQFADVMRDMHSASLQSGTLVRLFVDAAPRLFSKQAIPGDALHISGTQYLLDHPEFDDAIRLRGIIELMESEEVIVHLMDTQLSDQVGEVSKVNILIGGEMSTTVQSPLMQEYSLLTTNYRYAEAVGGVIGVIGPKRMNYGRMMSIVQHVAYVLSQRVPQS